MATDIKDNDAHSKMQRSAYAAVVFHNVAEMYPADAHVECSYTITVDIEPTTRDWVGLFKVGWMSPADYFYYEWAPYPKNYTPDTECQSEILFQAHNLPDDDGEFYQFCYVTRGSQIRGASTPFQFKRPSAGDFVEVEDDENDMLIVQEKTIYLEENLREAVHQKASLMQHQEELEKEKKTLRIAVKDVKKRLRLKTAAFEELRKELEEKKRELQDNDKSTQDLIVVHDELRFKLEQLEKEKKVLEEKLEDMRNCIAELREKDKVVQNEKDELDGQNRSLKEETEMIKNHLTKSEHNVSNYAGEITAMKKDLAEKECYIAACQMEIATLKSELHQQSIKVEQRNHVMASNIENVEKLQEKLRNTEDKLEAAVKIKELMTEELSNCSAKYEEVYKELQGRRTENLELKKNVERMELEFSQESDVLIRENDGVHRDLCNAVKEKEELQQQVTQLQEEQCKDNTTGPMYALTVANDTLKHRHKLMRTDLDKAQTEMKSVQASASTLEKELRREIQDLKERIDMCSEAYRQLYKDNVKIQKKCKHCKAKIVNEPNNPFMKTEKMQRAASTETDKIQRAVSTETEAVALVTSDCNTDYQNMTSKETQSDSLITDVKAKLIKYKKLYNEQKLKYESFVNKYEEDMKRKDIEIYTLRSTIISRPNDLEHKLMSCTSFLAEKDKQIAELNHKLRELKTEQEAPMSPSKQAASGCIMHTSQNGDITFTSRMTNLPPFIYPHIPRTLSLTSTTDHLSDSDNSDGLPAPMAPTVLPSAKVAAIKASYYPHATEDQLELNFVDAPTHFIKAQPTAPFDIEEDQFVDAKGVGMKTCPECDKSFSPDITDSEYENHVLNHSGRICPVCNLLADDNTSDTDFQYHVNCCIDNKSKEE